MNTPYALSSLLFAPFRVANSLSTLIARGSLSPENPVCSVQSVHHHFTILSVPPSSFLLHIAICSRSLRDLLAASSRYLLTPSLNSNTQHINISRIKEAARRQRKRDVAATSPGASRERKTNVTGTLLEREGDMRERDGYVAGTSRGRHRVRKGVRKRKKKGNEKGTRKQQKRNGNATSRYRRDNVRCATKLNIKTWKGAYVNTASDPEIEEWVRI